MSNPFNLLPDEILGHIFRCSVIDNQRAADSHIVPDNTSIPNFYNICWKHSTCAPWDITYVCSRWRAVCSALPELWTHIGIFINNNPRFSANLDRLSAQIDRVGPELKLSVAVYVAQPVMEGEDRELVLPYITLLSLLLSTAQNWRAAALLDRSDVFFELFAEHSLHLPSLERLLIHRSEDHPWQLPPCIQSAIQLGSLCLDMESAYMLNQCPHFQVTDLCLFEFPRKYTESRMLVYALDHFIPTFPHLRQLSLLHHAVITNQSFTLITLPSILSLTVIELNSRGNGAEMLQVFTLPNLQSLRVGCDHSFQTVMDFIQRSGCSLLHLAYKVPRSGWNFTSHRLAPLLECTPQLQSLNLGGATCIDDQFIRMLAVVSPQGIPSLCPQLQYVCLKEIQGDHHALYNDYAGLGPIRPMLRIELQAARRT